MSNKAYFIAPLAALVVFSGVYASHRSGLKEREAAKAAAAKAELVAKNEAEQAARKAAMAEAIALAEQRKKEKERREAREAAERAERQVALDARDQAYREQEKLGRQIERLKKDIEAEEAVIARLEVARKEGETEKAFLADFVAKSRANVKALETLVAKLNASAPVSVSSAASGS